MLNQVVIKRRGSALLGTNDQKVGQLSHGRGRLPQKESMVLLEHGLEGAEWRAGGENSIAL